MIDFYNVIGDSVVSTSEQYTCSFDTDTNKRSATDINTEVVVDFM